MDERERAIAKAIYDNTMDLWEAQGEEINALRKANEALQRSHERIGEIIRLVGELVKVAS